MRVHASVSRDNLVAAGTIPPLPRTRTASLSFTQAFQRLLPEPRLLLLDEPATGLDLPGRERLIEALEELRTARPALATVLVTHHLEELPAGITQAVLLHGGRVPASGPVGSVLTDDQAGTCFGLPLALERHEGRWSVRIRRVR